MSPRPPLPRTGAAVLAAGLLALGLSGCATRPTLPKYAAPTGSPTAKLVMRGNVRSGDIYGVYVFDDAQACQGARIAGAGSAGRDPVSLPIAADRLTTLDFMLFTGKDACRVRWSFTPTAGRTYLVAGGTVTGVPGALCLARVLDATDPDKIHPAPDAVRRNVGGNACVAMANARVAAAKGAEGGQSGGDAVLTPGASADDLKGLISP